jgi:YbgC/YbaW family acyl-CoA thioester hydrolase
MNSMNKVESNELIGINEIIIKPRFCDIDSLLIVHHSRFVVWVEEANFTFFEKVVDMAKKDFLDLDMYNPIKKISIAYKNSIRWEDEVVVSSRMEYSRFAQFKMYNTLYCKNNPNKIFARAEVELLITNKELGLTLMAPDFFLKRINAAEKKHPLYFKYLDNV